MKRKQSYRPAESCVLHLERRVCLDWCWCIFVWNATTSSMEVLVFAMCDKRKTHNPRKHISNEFGPRVSHNARHFMRGCFCCCGRECVAVCEKEWAPHRNIIAHYVLWVCCRCVRVKCWVCFYGYHKHTFRHIQTLTLKTLGHVANVVSLFYIIYYFVFVGHMYAVNKVQSADSNYIPTSVSISSPREPNAITQITDQYD